METKNLKQTNPEETVNNTAQVSNQQPSAPEQKNNNNPRSTKNAAEESKTISRQEQAKTSGKSTEQTSMATPDIVADDTAQIFVWLENANQTPRQLKDFLDTLDTKIELIDGILSEQSEKSKRIPGIDRRIETLELFDVQLEIGEKYLSALNKIKLQTELTNLKEKRFLVWQKFVKIFGSERKVLQYERLRAKAKSKLFHSKSSYFVKQRILKIFNTILKDDKSGLEEVKNLANNSSDTGIKLFNERMRYLLDVHDEDLVILCSHHKREYYYQILRLTILKWNPETDIQITEIVEPDESE
jgi:hypothetical protein